jgi:hypothetical protein
MTKILTPQEENDIASALVTASEGEGMNWKNASALLLSTLRHRESELEQFKQSMSDFAVADEERQEKHRQKITALQIERNKLHDEAEDADLCFACIADQLGIKGSIKDWLQSIGGAICDLKAEVERLRTKRDVELRERDELAKAVREKYFFVDGVGRWCWFCGIAIPRPGYIHPPSDCIVLKCQNVTQVNLDTERTIDESGGQKGDEG